MEDFCKALGAPEEEAKPVLDELIRNGFISNNGPTYEPYVPGDRFSQIALATITEGIPRATAEMLLDSVANRAKQINANPREFGHRIIRLAVFGSFLRGEAVLGDLDIAFECKVHPMEEQRRELLREIRSNVSYRKTISYLRLRKPRQISLHEWKDLEKINTPFKIVFEEKEA